MKIGHHPLGRAVGVAVLLSLPTVSWADDLALVLTNSSYRDYRDAEDVVDRRRVVKAFEDAGFRVIGAQDLSAPDLQDAATNLQHAVRGGEVERLAIVLSGHFTGTSTDSWLLGSDASEDVSAITAGAEGLSVSAMTGLAGALPGQALVILVPASGDDRPSGHGLMPGLGAFDIPQGVTVAQGSVRAMPRWLETAALTPGISLAAAAQAAPEGVKVTGFLADNISLLPGGASEPAAPTPGVPTALAEMAFWNAARDIGSAESFEDYLQRYPDGLFAAEARSRIAALQVTPEQQAAADEAALSLSREARREVQRDLSLLGFDPRGIDGIFGPGSRAAIGAHQRSLGLPETGYLSEEQLRVLRRDADRRAAELEREAQERREQEERQDRAFWESIERGENEAGLRAYLEQYPDGLFADLAQQRLDQIEDDRRQQAAAEERNLWDQARQQDTPEAYRQFLQAFPDSGFEETARARLEQLETEDENRTEMNAARDEEAGIAGNQVVRALVEQRLNQIGLAPGALDGNFDEDTRRAIRRFQQATDLPVTGYVTQATMVRLLASGTLSRN